MFLKKNKKAKFKYYYSDGGKYESNHMPATTVYFQATILFKKSKG